MSDEQLQAIRDRLSDSWPEHPGVECHPGILARLATLDAEALVALYREDVGALLALVDRLQPPPCPMDDTEPAACAEWLGKRIVGLGWEPRIEEVCRGDGWVNVTLQADLWTRRRLTRKERGE